MVCFALFFFCKCQNASAVCTIIIVVTHKSHILCCCCCTPPPPKCISWRVQSPHDHQHPSASPSRAALGGGLPVNAGLLSHSKHTLQSSSTENAGLACALCCRRACAARGGVLLRDGVLLLRDGSISSKDGNRSCMGWEAGNNMSTISASVCVGGTSCCV